MLRLPAAASPLESLACIQASCATVFSSAKDIAALSQVSKGVSSAVGCGQHWRHLLCVHFAPAVEILRGCCTDPGVVSGQHFSKELYVQLQKLKPAPFVLEPRQRLILEIFELRQWDSHVKEFLHHRQAKHLAEKLEIDGAAARVCQRMANSALSLLSLKALMGRAGDMPRLRDLAEVQWDAGAERRLREQVCCLVFRRRKECERMRMSLLEDLHWR